MLIVSRPVPEDKTEYARIILRFIVYSLLAGAFAAVVLLPEMYALEYTASGKINFQNPYTVFLFCDNFQTPPYKYSCKPWS